MHHFSAHQILTIALTIAVCLWSLMVVWTTWPSKKNLMAQRKRTATHVHYKGGYYKVLGQATHTETGETMVVYKHVWPHEPSEWKTRPAANFNEILPDGRARFQMLPVRAKR